MRGEPRVSRVLWACVFAAVLVCAVAGKSTPEPPNGDVIHPNVGDIHTSEKQRFSIRAFFRRLDTDGDGQIETEELSNYVSTSVGGHDFDERHEITAAAKQTQGLIDGTDKGDTISEEELITHITRSTNQLLTPNRVARWVKFGLSLPQYAEAFSENAITALDFPFLLAEHCAALKEDLRIKSSLHRGKIARALKLQLLGLGAPPSSPTKVRAVAVNATAVAVQWTPPDTPGNPPLHLYVLQRRQGDNPKWEIEALIDAEDTAHVAHVAEEGDLSYNSIKNPEGMPARLRQYRVVAWGAHGSSGYSDPSEVVDVNGSDKDGKKYKKSNSKGSTKQAPGVNTILENTTDSGYRAIMRAAASSLVLAGVVARFLFGAAAWMGVSGTVRGIAFRNLGSTIGRKLNKSNVSNDGGVEGDADNTATATNGGVLNGVSNAQSTPAQTRRTQSAQANSLTPQIVSPENRSIQRRSAMFEDAMAAAVAAGVAGDSSRLNAHSESISEDVPRTQTITPPLNHSRSHSRNDSLISDDSAGMNISGDNSFDTKTNNVKSEAKKKGRCCVSGCDKRWDKWIGKSGFRMKHAHHYCGLCQRAYCAQHTATSPHGAKGRCDPESKCVCLACFVSLDVGTRNALEVHSKLPLPISSAVVQHTTPSSRARSRWQAVKQYQLRTGEALSPVSSVGDLRGLGSPTGGR